MSKFFFIPIIILLISGCSYKPILTSKQQDFRFENISYEGNNEINNIIEESLIKKVKVKKNIILIFQ